MHVHGKKTIEELQLVRALASMQASLRRSTNHVTRIVRNALEVCVHICNEIFGEGGIELVSVKTWVETSRRFSQFQVTGIFRTSILLQELEKQFLGLFVACTNTAVNGEGGGDQGSSAN